MEVKLKLDFKPFVELAWELQKLNDTVQNKSDLLDCVSDHDCGLLDDCVRMSSDILMKTRNEIRFGVV